MAMTISPPFDRQRSRWIPWAFVGAFMIVAAVNAGLAIMASRSWTGVVTETPYDTGNDYNRVIAETARETALGWKVGAEAVKADNGKVRISVSVDAVDKPLIAIEGSLLRPIGMQAPVPLSFEAVAPGRFQTELKLPEQGAWDLHLVIRGKDGQLRTSRRLFVE